LRPYAVLEYGPVRGEGPGNAVGAVSGVLRMRKSGKWWNPAMLIALIAGVAQILAAVIQKL